MTLARAAGRVFANRAEMYAFARELEGFDLDEYDGVWAFWNGTSVGAVGTTEYSEALSQAVLVEDNCAIRADEIMASKHDTDSNAKSK